MITQQGTITTGAQWQGAAQARITVGDPSRREANKLARDIGSTIVTHGGAYTLTKGRGAWENLKEHSRVFTLCAPTVEALAAPVQAAAEVALLLGQTAVLVEWVSANGYHVQEVRRAE